MQSGVNIASCELCCVCRDEMEAALSMLSETLRDSNCQLQQLKLGGYVAAFANSTAMQSIKDALSGNWGSNSASSPPLLQQHRSEQAPAAHPAGAAYTPSKHKSHSSSSSRSSGRRNSVQAAPNTSPRQRNSMSTPNSGGSHDGSALRERVAALEERRQAQLVAAAGLASEIHDLRAVAAGRDSSNTVDESAQDVGSCGSTASSVTPPLTPQHEATAAARRQQLTAAMDASDGNSDACFTMAEAERMARQCALLAVAEARRQWEAHLGQVLQTLRQEAATSAEARINAGIQKVMEEVRWVDEENARQTARDRTAVEEMRATLKEVQTKLQALEEASAGHHTESLMHTERLDMLEKAMSNTAQQESTAKDLQQLRTALAEVTKESAVSVKKLSETIKRHGAQVSALKAMVVEDQERTIKALENFMDASASGSEHTF
eukprot:TRINITY_DN16894_c0_g2_i1.p1 TRINITY_DN16894_c0_g2~~TRINITY_DN16894_c0_g2_i1.p1  ORF type:complete len:435 (+),score=113.06 TRINITY_DN16894_c0_g2_i1:1588-2892(+)